MKIKILKTVILPDIFVSVRYFGSHTDEGTQTKCVTEQGSKGGTGGWKKFYDEDVHEHSSLPRYYIVSANK